MAIVPIEIGSQDDIMAERAGSESTCPAMFCFLWNNKRGEKAVTFPRTYYCSVPSGVVCFKIREEMH